MLETLDSKIFEQGSPEWLEIRKKFITATDMSVIMGVNPWKTPYQLFEEKLGYTTTQENDAMRRGRDLEPLARMVLSKVLNIEMIPKVVFHPTNKIAMASLDAISEDGKTLGEIKCGEKDFEIAKKGKIPEHHIPQLQWQMYNTGLENMFFFAFNGKDYVLIPVKRDDWLIEEMEIKAQEFYECLKSLEPPLLTVKDMIQRNDQDWFHWAEVYRSYKNQVFVAETRMEEAKKKLIEMANDVNSMGNGVKVTKYFRKGNVDYASIPNFDKIDLEKYRKPGTYNWRVS